MTISRRLLMLAAAGVLAVLPAACGDDDDEGGGEAVEDTTTTSATTPEATEVGLIASLSGKEEVPGPGVTDGTGTADVRIAAEEVCYKLNVTMGEKPTLAHIHQGAAGAAGPVFIDLAPTFTEGESAFSADTCIKPDMAKAAQVSENPAGFYVNIHTAEHPNGAVRGQLSKSGY